MGKALTWPGTPRSPVNSARSRGKCKAPVRLFQGLFALGLMLAAGACATYPDGGYYYPSGSYYQDYSPFDYIYPYYYTPYYYSPYGYYYYPYRHRYDKPGVQVQPTPRPVYPGRGVPPAKGIKGDTPKGGGYPGGGSGPGRGGGYPGGGGSGKGGKGR